MMDVWELIAKLREKYRDRAWQPIIEAEIMADEIAKKVVSELLPRLPRERVFKPEIKPPHSLTKSKTFNLIEETNVAGSLIEVSLTITNTNFNVYLKVDGEMLLTGKSFTELMSLSRDLAWLTAIQDPNTSEYWLQIAGIEWKREFVLTIEPNEEITFYNISWSYIKYLG